MNARGMALRLTALFKKQERDGSQYRVLAAAPWGFHYMESGMKFIVFVREDGSWAEIHEAVGEAKKLVEWIQGGYDVGPLLDVTLDLLGIKDRLLTTPTAEDMWVMLEDLFE